MVQTTSALRREGLAAPKRRAQGIDLKAYCEFLYNWGAYSRNTESILNHVKDPSMT